MCSWQTGAENGFPLWLLRFCFYSVFYTYVFYTYSVLEIQCSIHSVCSIHTVCSVYTAFYTMFYTYSVLCIQSVLYIQCVLYIRLVWMTFLPFLFSSSSLFSLLKLPLQLYSFGDRNTMWLCHVPLVCIPAIKSLPNKISQTKGHSVMIPQMLAQHKTVASDADNTE